jgi:Cu/Ag efflux pump CusA
MTLGGLVVALGVVVDDAVIDVENILRRRRMSGPGVDIVELFIGASLEVRRPVFYATAAVAVAFLPILMMSGLQGAFFRPLSIAFLLAVGLSLAGRDERDAGDERAHDGAACSRSPRRVSASACKRGQLRTIAWLHERPRVLHRDSRWRRARRNRVPAPARRAPAAGFSRELPDRPRLAARRHLAGRDRARRQEISKGLMAIPGVKSVAEQIGRAENGQDPDAPNKSEFEVQIDPRQQHNAAEIDAAIRDVFDDYPNQLVEIYSVLAERIGETLSGESAPFSISVIGSDLDADDRVGAQIVDVLQHLPDSGNVA